MNILFVIKALAAGPGGGAERVLAAVSASLAKRGHKVTVLTFDALGTRDFYSVGPLVDRIRLGIGVTTERSGARVTWERLRQMRKVAARLRPDVAVGFMHSAFIPLGLALAGTRIPVVGSERTSYRHYQLHPAQNAILHLSLPVLTHMTANAEGVRDGFPAMISRRMTVIPNPVMKATGTADAVGSTRKLLLAIGGLRPEKDHETLIRAFAKLSPMYPDWHLRIVGEGELRGRLENLSSKLGTTRAVELPGATDQVDIEYLAAQLFVLPSIYEAFPNCVAEALAHGLPAVGFRDCPGTNELIQSGVNGVLVAGGSDRVQGLAYALEKLMSSPDRRLALGNAGPPSVSAYSLQAVTDSWEKLISRTVHD